MSDSKRMANVQRMALESEMLGAEIMSSLSDQRSQLLGSVKGGKSLKRVSSTSSARQNAERNDMASQILASSMMSRRGISVEEDEDDDSDDWDDSSDDEADNWLNPGGERAIMSEEQAMARAVAESLAMAEAENAAWRASAAAEEARKESLSGRQRKKNLKMMKKAAKVASARAGRSARVGQSQRTVVTPTDGFASIPVVPRGEGSTQEMRLKEEAARIRTAYEREVGTPFYVGREEGLSGQDAPVAVPVVRPRSTTVYVDAKAGGLTRAVLSVLGPRYRRMAEALLALLPVSLGWQERAEVEMAIYTFVFVFALSGADEGAMGLLPVVTEQGFDAVKAQQGGAFSGSDAFKRLLADDQVLRVITEFAQS